MSDPAEGPPLQSRMERQAVWDQAYRQRHPRWRGPSDLALSGLKGIILELGCGDGKTAAALVENGLNVVGLDLSRTALSTLASRIRSDRLCLVQADALDLPFADGSFDVVTIVHFLDHLLSTHRRRAVAEIGRVLRTGGVVIGRFFSVEDMRFGKGKEIEPNTFLRGNGVSNHYFTTEEILALFAGFSAASMDSSKKSIKFSPDSGHRSLITVELRRR